MRAVTFQSMSRTSSPNWYSRTSANDMPRPLKAEWYSPANMLLVKALVLISKRLTLLSNSDVSKVSQIFIFLLGNGGKGPSGRRRSDEKRGCRRLMRGLKARPSAHSPGCKPWVSGPPSDEPCKGDSSMRASKGAALTGLIGRKSAPPRPCSLGYELKVSPSGLRVERSELVEYAFGPHR